MMLSQWEATRPTSDFPSKTIHDGPCEMVRKMKGDDNKVVFIRAFMMDHRRDGEDGHKVVFVRTFMMDLM